MSYRGTGMGQVAMGSWPVLLIQTMLMNRAYDVGSGGASGTYDDGTRRAIEIALGKAEGSLAANPEIRVSGPPGAQLIEMPRDWFTALSNLAARRPPVLDILPGSGAGVGPWALGAAALAAGLGAFWWYRSRRGGR